MRADLSLQQTPPLSVPMRYFLSAPLFGIGAALILLWYGPQVFSNRWAPELLTVTHLLTLGFLVMTMVGAMQQLLPVLMGAPIAWAKHFSVFIHATLFTGCVSLGLAWLTQSPGMFIAAISLLGLALSVFIIVSAHRLLTSPSTHATRIKMLLALAALAVTMVLGIRIAMAYGGVDASLARNYTDLHMSWGMLGWVVLLVMAVAYQLIPMFQITDEYPWWHRHWLGWIQFTALLLLTIGQLGSYPELVLAGKAGLVAGLMIFALTSIVILYRRRRKLPDVTLSFWYLSFVSLLASTILWLLREIPGIGVPDLVIGITIIVGFAMSAVNGMMYKIVPFLIWLHLNLHRTEKTLPQSSVPNIRQIMPERYNRWQFYLHGLSLLMLVLVFAVSEKLFYPAVVIMFFSQGLLLANLVSAVKRYSVIMARLN